MTAVEAQDQGTSRKDLPAGGLLQGHRLCRPTHIESKSGGCFVSKIPHLILQLWVNIIERAELSLLEGLSGPVS